MYFIHLKIHQDSKVIRSMVFSSNTSEHYLVVEVSLTRD